MLEMQAVIGRIQLKRMAEWTAARERNAATLAAALDGFLDEDGPMRLPVLSDRGEGSRHAQYKFYAYVRPENMGVGWSRDRMIDEVVRRGVPCYQGSCSEVYLEKAFDHTGWRPLRPLPVARELGQTSLMFLVHPTLTQAEVKVAACTVSAVMALVKTSIQ
jgi:dTDP-4-amino-4,6-dideoxygalactose transaminase